MKFYAHHIDGKFTHIFKSEIQVKMCGNYPIVTVEVTEDENGDYWGWKDKEDRISMIFKDFRSLAICFTYGIEISEKTGKGNRVRLSIKLIEEGKNDI